jgi:hypothetical protein
LSFGKTVVLRGAGYTTFIPNNFEFVLYRVPTRLVSWALEKRSKSKKWELARRPGRTTAAAPIVVVDSDPIVLAPGGFFQTHRWQFSDTFDNWSPVVRTTRFSTLKASISGGYHGAKGGIDTTITTTVDPLLRIELVLPWEGDSDFPTVRDILKDEVQDWMELDESVDSTEVLALLEPFLPSERPSGFEIGWEPVILPLAEEGEATVHTSIFSASSDPVAFCFVARNEETGEFASSEVGVLWSDSTGGLSLYGLEG